METNQVESLLKETLSLDEIIVKANGSHYEVIAVGACFEGLRRLKREQLIYGPLMDTIKEGTIHAVSIKAFTAEEWQKERKFILPQ